MGSDTPDMQECFIYLFSALDSALSTHGATAVTFLLRLMALIPNASIDTLHELVVEAPKTWQNSKYAELIRELDPIARSYFETQFYGPGLKVTKDAVGRKLYALMANPLFLKMFSASASCFDALECMQNKKLVLINASRKKLGEDPSKVYARFFISQILAAFYRRGELPERDRHLSLLIVDEAGPHYDNQAERLLSTARKFNVGFVTATQFLEQIPAAVKAAIYANTSIKLIGPVSHSDATALAREMYTTPNFIRSMQKLGHPDKYKATEYACYVRNQGPTVKLTVPFWLLEELPRMTDADHAAMREKSRKTVTISHETSKPTAPESVPVTRAQPQHAPAQPSTGAGVPASTDDPAEPGPW